MKDLILELIPNAPNLGLYTAPHIPEGKLRAALADYAPGVAPGDVIALYDATLIGTARDGALFLADRFVFQNTDLEAPQTIPYAHLVRVEARKKLLGGQKVYIDVNQARATITLKIDFSGRPAAADYVARFLHEALLRGADEEMQAAASTATDAGAVEAALAALVQAGKLAPADFERLLRALG